MTAAEELFYDSEVQFDCPTKLIQCCDDFCGYFEVVRDDPKVAVTAGAADAVFATATVVRLDPNRVG